MRRMFSKSQIEKIIDEHGGGGQPAEFIKSAEVNEEGTKLTLIDQDDESIEFAPEIAAGAVTSVNGQTGDVYLDSDLIFAHNKPNTTVHDEFVRVDEALDTKSSVSGTYDPSTDNWLTLTVDDVSHSMPIVIPFESKQTLAPVMKSINIDGTYYNMPEGGSGSVDIEAGDGILVQSGEEADYIISADFDEVQPKLTAGRNIAIDANNVISAADADSNLLVITTTDGTGQSDIRAALADNKKVVLQYTNSITHQTSQADLLSCPSSGNITFATPANSEGYVIQFTLDTNDSWTTATTTLTTKTYVDNHHDDTKQGKLTAGANITIDANNVISASGGGGSGITSIIAADETVPVVSGVATIPNTNGSQYGVVKMGNGLRKNTNGKLEVAVADSEDIDAKRANAIIDASNLKDGIHANITAGTGITISANNVISATGSGDGIESIIAVDETVPVVDGVATIPNTNSSQYGLVKMGNGLRKNTNGKLEVAIADSEDIDYKRSNAIIDAANAKETINANISAGTGIAIDSNNVISATGLTASHYMHNVTMYYTTAGETGILYDYYISFQFINDVSTGYDTFSAVKSALAAYGATIQHPITVSGCLADSFTATNRQIYPVTCAYVAGSDLYIMRYKMNQSSPETWLAHSTSDINDLVKAF